MFDALYNFVPKQGDHGDQGDRGPGNPHQETAAGWSPSGRGVVPLVHEGDQGPRQGGPPGEPHGTTASGDVVPLVPLVPVILNNEFNTDEGERRHREAIAAALEAEAAEHEALLRADPRARWRSLPADHPGGLCGRFGPAAAGSLLTAVHTWENAWTDDEAAEALAAFNALADRALSAGKDGP